MATKTSFLIKLVAGLSMLLAAHTAFGVNLPACTSMAGSNELCVVTTGKLTNPVGPDPLALSGSNITTVTGTLSANGAAWSSGWSVLGAPMNPGSSQTYSGVPLTLASVASQLTLFCKGGATVNLNATAGGDSINVTSCSLFAGTLNAGTITTSINFPANTIAQAIPQRFASVAVGANSTATYVCTLGPPLCASSDPTTLTLSNGNLSATCVGCAGMGLTPPSPGPLTFTAQQGGAAPPSQPVTVADSPTAAISYAVTTSTTDGANWLSVNPAGGQTGSSPTFNVSVSPGSLTQGTYTGKVTVSGAFSNSPLTETVNFTVTPNSAPFNLVPAPTLFIFSSVNSSSPPAQNLSVGTSPSTSAPFTAAATSTGNWLSVTPFTGTTGTTTISVTADPTKVTGPPPYSGTITLTANGATNSPLTVPVTFNVTSVPKPSDLIFNGIAGGSNPPTQPLAVTATGPNVSYTAAVTSGNSWLSIAPGSGTTNGAAQTVSVNTAGLSANTYHGTITITPNGGAAIPVAVTLTVTSLPSMVPSPTQLPFTSNAGSVPASQNLGITSSGGQITYNVAATTTGGNWLTVLPTNGITPGSETVSIDSTVLAGLATGTYQNAVVFTCQPTTSCGNANGQLSVLVTLTVTAALSPVPTSLTFNYTIGGSAPAAQPIAVSSNGGAITYTATAATTTGGGWLAVSPASPTTVTTPTGVSASVNAGTLAGLAAGSYIGSITLASAGASNSPVTISATLVVSAALGTSVNSLAFAYQTGGTIPPGQTVNITSNGAPLNFTATAAGASNGITWLSVSPASGTTQSGGTPVTVSVAPGSLPAAPAPYIGTITIASTQAGNGPLTVTVSLTVSALPSLTASPSSLSANYTLGGSVPVLPAVTIGSSGTALSNVSVGAPTVPWLSVSQTGTTTPNVTLTISLVSASLPSTPGPASGSFTINAADAAAPLTYTVTLNVSPQPVLSVSPLSLTFTGIVNGAQPAAKPLSVTSINGSVSFTAAPATASGSNWLSVSPTSGSTNATPQVSVNTAGLAIGTYSGSITVTASGASGSPVNIPVSLTVAPVPVLTATPTTLSFSYSAGGVLPTGQSVAISTSNAATTPFSLSATTASGINWLQVPSTGAAPGSFVVGIAAGGLTAGTYNGTITVSATGFTPATVAVTLVVTQPKAVIQVSGSTVFALANTAAPATSTLAISASDGLGYQFTIAAGASQNNWLTLVPSSGTTPANVKLTVTPAGLIPGIYVIPITVTMPALQIPTFTVQAQLTITGSDLAASPSALTFVYQPGAPLPVPQTVSLTTASGTGTVLLDSVSTDAAWLHVTSPPSAPATLQVSIGAGLVKPGIYTGDVIVKGVGSPAASLEIPVTITVNPAPQLTATPASLSFDYQIGGTAPAPQSFALAAGDGQLSFTATSPGSWVQLSPLHGNTPGSVLVTVNPAGLAAGTFGGTIKVTAYGAANPVAVAVTLTVAPPGPLTIAPGQLTFTAPEGGSAAPQTLTISSASGPLGFTAAAGSPWLSVTPTTGTTPATLSVSVNPAGLQVGIYNGAIALTAAGSASQQTVPVTLQVGNPVTPTIQGVINAASGAPGTVSPGMAISIFGSALGPHTGVEFAAPAEGGTVATTLAGTQVLFDDTAVPVLFTMDGQVNALAPFELANKPNTVLKVTYNGITSLSTTLPVAAAEPALFTADTSGKGQGAILNQDYSVNSASHPAAAGSAIMLFGTGGGLTDPASTDGALNPIPPPLGKLKLKTTATVGGQPAEVLYAGPAPGLLAGIFQINVTIPSGTPSGNVAVVVKIGTAGSQTVTVAVQ